MAVVNSNFELNIVSFNMKGFHQGFSVVSDLVEQCKPDLFLLQEHWLTSDRLYMFDKFFLGISTWVAQPCQKPSKRVC